MKITLHGDEKTLERTKLSSQEVVALILGDAFVCLGSWEQFDYLLFHSAPDRDEKIAVVDAGGKALVSVWETHFHLPYSAREPTSEDRREAQRLCREYLSKRDSS